MDTIGIDIKALQGKSVFNYCRQLLKEGFAPSTRVEVYRDGKDYYDFCVPSIEEGAKWSTRESPSKGPDFVRYKPFSSVGGEAYSDYSILQATTLPDSNLNALAMDSYRAS